MVLIKPTALIGLESIIELISLFATFAIGYAAARIYRLTKEKRYLYFSTAFLFLTLGFLIRTFINAGIYFGRKDVVEIAINTPVITIYKALSLIYLMAMISAYLILIILTFKIQDFKLVSLFVIFALVSLVASYKFYIVFPILSFLLLLHIVIYYASQYHQSKKPVQGWITFGFIVIAVAQLAFPFIYYDMQWFVFGTAIQLLGYLILLASLIKVLQK